MKVMENGSLANTHSRLRRQSGFQHWTDQHRWRLRVASSSHLAQQAEIHPHPPSGTGCLIARKAVFRFCLAFFDLQEGP